jgi:DNA-binding transcriptional MerR regulator
LGINEIVRDMDPPRYTITQAARLVGRSVDTLRRWRDEDVYQPSDSQMFGSLTVDLYTKEDITAMKDIARNMKMGRKPTNA